MTKSFKYAIAIAALLILGALGVLHVVSKPDSSATNPGEGSGEKIGMATPAPISLEPAPGASGIAAAAAARIPPAVTARETPARASPSTASGLSVAASSAAGPLQATPAPSATDARAEAFTPEQFQALTAKTLRELPTAAQMQDLTPEEAHGYPAPMAKAGPMLGRIAQAAQDQPSLAGAATEFYLRCTEDADVLTPIRALCYSHVLKDPKAPPARSLPSEVVRLAHLIPEE